MSLEEIRAGRDRLAIHKAWTGTVTVALVLGFAAYVLTMCFWR